MFMNIMATVAVCAVIADLDAVCHLDTGVLTFCFADPTSYAVERFDDSTSEKREETHIFFTLAAIR